MMPKRVADTDPNTQISEFIGSGPFVFKRTSGSRATRSSTSSSTSTSRAPSRRPASPAARSSRSTASSGSPISDQQQAVNALLGGRDRHDRAAGHRPDPAAEGRQEHQADRPTTRSACSTPSASTTCTSRSTIRRSARRCRTPSTRRISSTRRSAIPTTTRSARRCSSAARRSPPTRAWTGCSSPTSRRRRSC